MKWIDSIAKKFKKSKFPSPSPIMWVAEEQLQNLLRQRIAFLLLDLRKNKTSVAYEGAIPVSPSEVLAHVQSKISDRQLPVILFCENGKTSHKAAKQLAKAGYYNLFVLKK